MTPQITHSTTCVDITIARLGADDAPARALFAEQRQWLQDIGIDVSRLHPATDLEYEHPVDFYRNGALLLARRDDVVIGMIALAPWAHRTAEIRRLYVRPAARGAAAGPALVTAIIHIARDHGYRRLVLDTLPGPMDAAIHLYRRAGFRQVSPFHVDHPGIIGMQLDLESGAALDGEGHG